MPMKMEEECYYSFSYFCLQSMNYFLEAYLYLLLFAFYLLPLYIYIVHFDGGCQLFGL